MVTEITVIMAYAQIGEVMPLVKVATSSTFVKASVFNALVASIIFVVAAGRPRWVWKALYCTGFVGRKRWLMAGVWGLMQVVVGLKHRRSESAAGSSATNSRCIFAATA